MAEIYFLDIEDLLAIHAAVLEETPGEPSELLDADKLDSAIAQPRQQFGGQFLHQDLFEMAAAYCFHVTMAHAFLAGNKRVGALAALIFLNLNGVRLTVDQDSFAALVLEITTGKAGKPELTAFFRSTFAAQRKNP